MSKKFTKTVLSTALAGVLFGVSFGVAAEEYTKGEYKVIVNGVSAIIYKNNDPVIAGINTKTGSAITINQKELLDGSAKILKENGLDPNKPKLTADVKGKIQNYINTIKYPVYAESLKKENLKNITVADIEKIKSNVDAVSTVITSKTAADYNQAVSNGMSSEAALTVAVLKEVNRIDSKIATNTTFAIDADGNITLDETAGPGERYGVKDVVADVVADTTVYAEEDGSLTMDNSAPARKRVNEALVDLDKSVRERTTVGVSSDGTLTRAEGAKNTISVNDGLVALSGRTDRIDAAVGAIDGRVTRNTQSIEKNSKAIAANTRTLQQHSARLDSQQRQINENHKEMKRAAAQSAALTGLFQPYSVGKFNATAAVGGYSDQQALAVGVGYRFNEQTAAKAGVAFSDGDASWNVGVNFEF